MNPVGKRSTAPPSSDQGDTSEPAAEEVTRLMDAILGNKPTYKSLLGLKGDRAQIMLDIMHKIMDTQDIPMKTRNSVLYAIVRLCEASGAFPHCFALQGIQYEAKPVASGTFGDIWRGHHNNHPVCLKVARVYQTSDVEHLIKVYMREAIVWSRLNHPNVLPFYGIYKVDERLGSVCLVSPWMERGNINEYLKAHPEAPRLPLVHGILAGLSYLHEQSVVHGDLKGANILISRAGSVCLADFGLSSMIGSEILRWTSLKSMTRLGGTVRWQAPELMDDLDDSSQPTFSADVYSIASVMYEIFTGQIPFYEIRSDITVISRVIRGLRPTRPSTDQDSELSAELWELMGKCWSGSAGERPSANLVAEKLSRIPLTELTVQRIQKLKWKQDVGVDTPSSLSFRAAMRGHNARFSKAEVDLLLGYAGGSAQGTSSTDTLPPGFHNQNSSVQEFLDPDGVTVQATTTRNPLGDIPSTAEVSINNPNIPNTSQAALATFTQPPPPSLATSESVAHKAPSSPSGGGADTGFGHHKVKEDDREQSQTLSKSTHLAQGCMSQTEDLEKLWREASFKRAQMVETDESPTSPHPDQPKKSPSNSKKSKVSLQDPTWKVLPEALKKYGFAGDWEDYVMFICYTSPEESNRIERCLYYDEKPLLLFQKLKYSMKSPVFMLKRTVDVRSPIALVQQKQAAQKAGPSENPIDTVITKDQHQALLPLETNYKPPRMGSSYQIALPGHYPLELPEQGYLKSLVEQRGNAPKLPLTSSNNASPTVLAMKPYGLDGKMSKNQHNDDPTPLSYAVAIYPHRAEQNDEFDVAIDDAFIILSRSQGWWIARRDPECPGAMSTDTIKQGRVPAGCLLQLSVPISSAIASAQGGLVKNPSKTSILPSSFVSASFPNTALMGHKRRVEGELDIAEGEQVRIFKRYQHWSYAIKVQNGDRGWIPSWILSQVSSS